MKKCDCEERIGIKIDSIKIFDELKKFFNRQVETETFTEIPVTRPHYIGFDGNGNEYKWFADKWYKCNCCGTLWEFIYPDFPACGEIRKFPDGVYKPE